MDGYPRLFGLSMAMGTPNVLCGTDGSLPSPYLLPVLPPCELRYVALLFVSTAAACEAVAQELRAHAAIPG